MKTQSILLLFILSVGCLEMTYAQADEQEQNGKITIEMTKEINGEKKTFKGEYENEEQMRADPNYQEFAGDDRFDFWFNGDKESTISLWVDRLKDDTQSMFKFSIDDDSSFVFNLDDWASTDWKAYLKDLDVDVDALIHRRDHGQRTAEAKRIRIMEVEGNEFGKRGKVDKNETLILEDLDFYPNPSNDGRMKLKFKVPEEDELTIRVFNLNDKVIYNRYFERFAGTYSESLDLSEQKEGSYLLEIMLGKERLTKKILIN